MSRDDLLLEAEMSMEKSVDYMVHEFAAVRTGKASPGLVENVDVHAYGSTMKLKQLALITTPEARLLVVQPFDAGTVQDIEKALKESKIGIMPAVDGKIIRLPIPELSEERRKELVRSLSKMAEEARVRVRANRRAALDEAKKLKAAGELTEDGLRDAEGTVQKLTDRLTKSALLGSITSRTFEIGTRISRSFGPSTRSMTYCRPEHPPPMTARRNAPSGLPFLLATMPTCGPRSRSR